MRPSLVAAAAAVFLALPLAAQDGGMANRTSPSVGQSITFTNGGSVELKYRAITWAQGRWMNQLKTEEGRSGFNNNLKSKPTGTLTTAKDMTLGGQTVKAGTYKLYFQVDDASKFQLVLADDAGTETKWKLDLAESKEATNTRLTLTITPSKSDTEANFGIAFGTMACTVTLSATTSGAKDASAPHKAGKDK